MYEEDYYGDEQAAAEEAAYQEMCEAGAYEEQMMMEAEGEAESMKAQIEQELEIRRKHAEEEQIRQMQEALEHGTINKDPDSKVTPEEIHDCIEREKILMEEKRERRCKQCHCHGTNENQTSNDS